MQEGQAKEESPSTGEEGKREGEKSELTEKKQLGRQNPMEIYTKDIKWHFSH